MWSCKSLYDQLNAWRTIIKFVQKVHYTSWREVFRGLSTSTDNVIITGSCDSESLLGAASPMMVMSLLRGYLNLKNIYVSSCRCNTVTNLDSKFPQKVPLTQFLHAHETLTDLCIFGYSWVSMIKIWKQIHLWRGDLKLKKVSAEV